MCYVWVVTHTFPTEVSNTERQDYIYRGGRLPKPKPNTQGGGYTIEMTAAVCFRF